MEKISFCLPPGRQHLRGRTAAAVCQLLLELSRQNPRVDKCRGVVAIFSSPHSGSYPSVSSWQQMNRAETLAHRRTISSSMLAFPREAGLLQSFPVVSSTSSSTHGSRGGLGYLNRDNFCNSGRRPPRRIPADC